MSDEACNARLRLVARRPHVFIGVATQHATRNTQHAARIAHRVTLRVTPRVTTSELGMDFTFLVLARGIPPRRLSCRRCPSIPALSLVSHPRSRHQPRTPYWFC
jgi:hypothetical protein